MIDICDISGLTKFSTEINTGAKARYTMMKEDYIVLPFSLDEPVYFCLGDYVDMSLYVDDGLGGKIAKIYELVDLYQPTYNISTGGYDYQLKLDAYYVKWKNKIFKYTPEHGGQEAAFSLTATLDVHLDLFLRNLSALGYKYRGAAFTYQIDQTVANAPHVINYQNTNMFDALTLMAEAWGTEWWVDGSVIFFGRCEFSDAVDLEIGVEASTMSRSDSKGTYATRIYAFGSTRNIPKDYREVDQSVVVNGVVQRRLMLPSGTPYIDAYPGMKTEEAVESVVIFDDIYPHRVGTMSSVTAVPRTEEIEEEDGSTTQETYTVYRYKDTGLDFDSKYILPGEELQITFQTGSLSGMTFGVAFNPDNKNPEEQLWEIVRNEDYGVMLPNDTLKPKDGDTYILSGFDSTMVSDLMIPEAEQELKARAEDYIEKTKVDDGTYTATLASSWVNADLINRTFGIGQRVNLINPAFFEDGRVSRILGFEFNLDKPQDSPVYTIGESTAYTRFGELEAKIDGLSFNGNSYVGVGGGSGSGGGASIYVIRTNDSTPPSDSNVFSALRSLSTFIRKDRPDSTNYLLSLLGGAITDNLQSQAFAAGPFGTGYLLKRDPLTGKSYMELDEIYVRLKAYFDTLEIKHLSHVGGRIVLSPASMECSRVEVVAAQYEQLYDKNNSPIEDSTGDPVLAAIGGGEQAYRCYFKQDDGEKSIVNEFAVDDLVQCREFNVKEGTSHNVQNQYYWRRVINVGEDFIDLSITDCDTGSMEPKAGDTIVTIGNKTDVSRQNVVFLSSYDDDAPCMKFYSRINSYSMLNKEVTVISPNADKNVFTGQVVIKPGSTGYENLEGAPNKAEIEQGITEAKQEATNAIEAAAGLQENVSEFQGYVNGAFRDDIITDAEKLGIAKYINIIENERLSAQSTYNELYNNPHLEGSAKVGLSNAWSSLSSAITSLTNSINTAIADSKTNATEKADVDSKYNTVNTRMQTYTQAVEAANESIQAAIKAIADNANNRLNNIEYLKALFPNDTFEAGAVIAQMAVVQDTGGVVRAGLNGTDIGKDSTHGKVLMFAGSGGVTEADIKGAKTKIYEDGRIDTVSAKIEGDLYATGGRIGSFWTTGSNSFVSQATITYTSGTHQGKKAYTEINLNPTYAYFRAEEEYDGADITVSVSRETDRLTTVESVFDKDGNLLYQTLGAETRGGLFAKMTASNPSSNTMYAAITAHSDCPGSYASAAFLAEKGMFAGLRPLTKVVSSSYKLTEYDYNVLVLGTGTVILTLDTPPQDGQHYTIWKPNKEFTLAIRGNGRLIHRIGRGDASEVTIAQADIVLIEVTYFEDGNKWFLIIHDYR